MTNASSEFVVLTRKMFFTASCVSLHPFLSDASKAEKEKENVKMCWH